MRNTVLGIAIFILVIETSISAISQTNDLSSSEKNVLTSQEFQYVYNRGFDMAIKDSRTSIDVFGIYHVKRALNYDSIYITIQPILDQRAFDLSYIDSLQQIDFMEIEESWQFFSQVRFLNTGNIRLQHCGEDYYLKDSHLIHTIFSPIYRAGENYYFGIKILRQVETTRGIINEKSTIIYSFQLCENNHIVFKKIFLPIGILDNKNICSVHEIEDKTCE